MKTLIPRYNSARMVMDYVRDFYGPAARQTRRLPVDDAARTLAQWKRRVREAWPGVRLQMTDPPPAALEHGERLKLKALVQLNGLSASDVAVECVLGHADINGKFATDCIMALHPAQTSADGATFSGDLEPLAGLQQVRLRVRPANALQSHPLELGLVLWA
jgi:starch phosphorylase